MPPPAFGGQRHAQKWPNGRPLDVRAATRAGAPDGDQGGADGDQGGADGRDQYPGAAHPTDTLANP
jgi:hypothetical protein